MRPPEHIDAGDPNYASPAHVSRALGVGVSTVKRWVDDGILPARVTPGGHRKLHLRDVLRLAQEGKLPNRDLSILAFAPLDSSARLAELERAVDSEDFAAIGTLLIGAYQSGASAEILADELIAPALRRLGHQWAARRVTIAREHRITQSFIEALYRINSQLRGPSGVGLPVALGCAPESDHYILPTLLAKMTLAEAGWNAVNIGPNTPFSALASAVDEMNPTLVWLTASHIPEAENFVAEYRAFYGQLESRGIELAMGGQALTPEIRGKLPYATFGDSFGHLAAIARQLHAEPKLPKRGRPPGRKSIPAG